MTIEIETKHWSFTYDWKQPKGYGNWAFEIGGEVKFYLGMYSAAKRQAMKDARAAGVQSIKLMP